MNHRIIPLSLLALSLVLPTSALTQESPTAETPGPSGAPREGVVPAADGVSITYEIHGEGEPALVLVHCWACHRGFWREQVAAFASDRSVVVLDLPGHGASGRDRAEWTLEAYAADVARVVDHLGLARVVLVGHSMGGPVSLLAAPALHDRLAGIVCVDTLHDADFAYPAEAMEQWAAAMAADYEGAMRFGVTGMVPSDEALREWIIGQALEADRQATTTLIRSFATFDLAAALSAAGAPVRCINAAPYGEMSLPTAVETNRRYADFDAVLMEGVGHYPHLERPAEFNERMRAILTELEGAAR
jgi:pimeloyl-ACP methyl ester carboxylesterase